ncbi:hypothetical protein FBULB1_14164 [Fusarium bulbicola]|nr:hypothetical protein FBULB1_14164 [Fusarium bulbicola]
MFPPNELERNEIAKQLLGDVSVTASTNTAFKAYFDYYDSVICPYSPGDTAIHIDTPALQSHLEVLKYVQFLCANSALSREEFLTASLPTGNIMSRERERVARAIVKVAFMVDCLSKDFYSEGLRSEGLSRVKWEENQRFLDFMKQAFASDVAQTTAQQENDIEALQEKKALKAWKLVRRYGIKIRPTNNLLEHLLYDPREKVLKVFHQTAFLRASLKRTKDEPLDLDFEQALRIGTLPPRLLFETLVSFHSILFPIASINNERSHLLLEKLIRTQGFDPEGLWVEFVRPLTSDFTFMYWGGRLARLYDVVKRPPPRNVLVSWVERHTSERNALTLAIIGLFLAVFFGLLGFITSVIQVVVSWMAWKHPI